MTAGDFPFLADANIDHLVVAALRSSGRDVFAVREEGLGTAEDQDLIRLEYQDGRVILTHDRGFGRLAFGDNEPVVGIIYGRPGHLDASHTIDSLNALWRKAMEVVPPFFIVVERKGGHVRIRVRHA